MTNPQTLAPLPGPAARGPSGPALQLLQLANAQFARGDLKTTRILLQAVVELAPPDPLLLGALGSVHFQLGEFRQARRRLLAAIELDGANALLHAKLGAACLALRDLPAFEAALERALVLDPNCADALQLLANASLQCGSPARAAQLYRRLVALKPDDASALLALAKCLFVLEDRAGARAMFERVLRIEPGNAVARENLAVLDARAGGPAGAVAPGANAEAAAPSQPAADVAQWVAQAEAACARGELPAALGALRMAAHQAPLCAPLWLALANIQTQLRLYPDALESCLAADALQPDVVDTLVPLAAAALRCDDIRRFEAALGRALELAPNHVGALRLLADLNFQEQRFPDAARQYSQILSQTPQDTEVALRLGRCELEAGHLEAARRALEQVLELEPGLESAQQDLNRIEEKSALKTSNHLRERVKVDWLGVAAKLAQLRQPAPAALSQP